MTMLYAIIYLQAGVTLPLAGRAAGLPVSAFGLVISLNAALVVIMQPLTVRVLDRVNCAWLLAAPQLAVGAGLPMPLPDAGVAD